MHPCLQPHAPRGPARHDRRGHQGAQRDGGGQRAGAGSERPRAGGGEEAAGALEPVHGQERQRCRSSAQCGASLEGMFTVPPTSIRAVPIILKYLLRPLFIIFRASSVSHQERCAKYVAFLLSRPYLAWLPASRTV